MNYRCAAIVLVFLTCACGSDDPPGGDDVGDTPDAAAATPDAPATTPDGAPATTPDAGTAPIGAVSCATPRPAGAPVPPPLPAYTGGVCPTLVPGANTLTSSGVARSFILVVPQTLPAGPMPVLVLWHYIGGDASSMVTNGQAQASADSLGVIIAVPEKRGDMTLPIGTDLDFAWPYLTWTPDSRVEEEARFFDDILTCVDTQYPVQEDCISSVGVSAGALWVSQLAQLRSERLANVIIISGGVGPALDLAGGFVDVRGWSGAARKVPTLIGWGGATDRCGIDFERASMNLESELGGHFVMECIHNCGHALPPVDPVAGLAALYRFALDHPYWLPAGQSPYDTTGVPAGTPDWCALGLGSAVARTGDCPQTSIDNSCPAI